MADTLAERLVAAAIQGLHTVDCFEEDHSDCRMLAAPVAVAVLREVAKDEWGATYVALEELTDLADQIEAGGQE